MSLFDFLFGRREPISDIWLSRPQPRSSGSILSDRMDGGNFYYGWYPDDNRQVNVRFEGPAWVAYVGGVPVGAYESKDAAEAGAVAYIKANPEPTEEGEVE